MHPPSWTVLTILVTYQTSKESNIVIHPMIRALAGYEREAPGTPNALNLSNATISPENLARCGPCSNPHQNC
jgi:hypothetical protein